MIVSQRGQRIFVPYATIDNYNIWLKRSTLLLYNLLTKVISYIWFNTSAYTGLQPVVITIVDVSYIFIDVKINQ